MNFSPEQLIKISPNGFLVYLCIQVVLLIAKPCPVEALNCYTCTSKEDYECTPLNPSGEVIPAENCNHPDTLLNNWIMSDDFLRAGFHDFEVDNLFNLLAKNEENSKRFKLIEVTACAYFYASSGSQLKTVENEDEDEGEVKAQDDSANELLTVQNWVMRDCVTLSLDEKSKENANHCFTVSGTDIANVRICTCTSDGCNKPDDVVQTFVTDGESCAGFLKSSVILTVVIFLKLFVDWI